MTEKNCKRAQEAAELERRAKQLRREEAAFLEEADMRKNELLERWGIETKNDQSVLKKLSDSYGCPLNDLLEYLLSEDQIKNYRNKLTHNMDDDTGSDDIWP